MNLNINWIVDADVSGFFDNIDHSLLQCIIRQRVNDGGMLRLIGRWLKAGVMDGEILLHPEKGTPQGGVVSPMVANIFLHEILDDWFEQEIKPRLRGRCFIIRFADDFVIGCELEDGAQRIMAVLPKRFGKYNLTIHPEKTTLVSFGRPAACKESGLENGTFKFLGFTHYWARSRQGYWVIKRKTAKMKMSGVKQALWQWCSDNRHVSLVAQYRILCSKLRGHYQYFGVRCNYEMMETILNHAKKAWRYWLNRRCHVIHTSGEDAQKTLLRKNIPDRDDQRPERNWLRQHEHQNTSMK